jgi:hypothetical protein
MNSTSTIGISEVNFLPIKQNGSHIGFVSFIFEGSFYFSSIAVHVRSNGGIRLVYPRSRNLDIFHPINRVTGVTIEKEIENQIKDLIN